MIAAYPAVADLVQLYPNVRLDTTMIGADFLNSLPEVPVEVVQRWRLLQDRTVHGSDFAK